jgi:hypothetical protein
MELKREFMGRWVRGKEKKKERGSKQLRRRGLG